MDRLGKKILTNQSEILFTNLEPKDFIDYIIQEDILTEEEREIVMAEVTRKGRVGQFIGFLKKKRNGFENLLKILDSRDLHWISEPLQNERDRLRQAGEDCNILTKMNAAKIRTRLTEKQCLEIGRYIGREWKVVAIDLGFESPDIYQIECENRDDIRMAAFTLLNKWGQRKVGQANISNLLPILDEHGIDYNEDNIIGMFS